MKTRISLFTALPIAKLDDADAAARSCARSARREGRPPSGETPHERDPVDIVIYHNPDCGTSRNTLAMIRNAGDRAACDRVPEDAARAGAAGVADRAHGRHASARCCGRRARPSTSSASATRALTDDAVARRHDGASDPDQPADRRLAARRAAVPSFGGRARPAARTATGRLHQGGRRAVVDAGRPPARLSLTASVIPTTRKPPMLAARHLPRHAAVRHLAARGPRHRLERPGGRGRGARHRGDPPRRHPDRLAHRLGRDLHLRRR